MDDLKKHFCKLVDYDLGFNSETLAALLNLFAEENNLSDEEFITLNWFRTWLIEKERDSGINLQKPLYSKILN